MAGVCSWTGSGIGWARAWSSRTHDGARCSQRSTRKVIASTDRSCCPRRRSRCDGRISQ